MNPVDGTIYTLCGSGPTSISAPWGCILGGAANRGKLQLSLLQQAIAFLDQQGAIGSYSQRCPSRGRPRRMLHLEESYRAEAEQLMPAWHRWLKDTESTSAAPQKVTAEVLSR